MSLIQHSIFRALCAIAVGVLLVKYRQEMVQWMTITIGVLFFLSGLVAAITSYVKRMAARKVQHEEQIAQESQPDDTQQPAQQAQATGCGLGTVVAIGCMLLGIVLALMPEVFINYLMYILAAFLILGALQQYFSLALAHREDSVSLGWWVMPSLLLLAGIFIIVNPRQILTAPLFFIGWCMIIYGVVEVVNGIKTYMCHRHAVARVAQMGKPDFSQAEEVEYEELPASETPSEEEHDTPTL